MAKQAKAKTEKSTKVDPKTTFGGALEARAAMAVAESENDADADEADADEESEADSTESEEVEEDDEAADGDESEEESEDEESEEDDSEEEESEDEDAEEQEDEEESEGEGKKAAEAKAGDKKADGETDSKNVPLQALHEERKKRQALEKEIASLKEQLGLDPSERKADSSEPTETDQRVVDISVKAARKVHKDYDEKFAAFTEADKAQDGRLLDMAYQSADPGEFVYQLGEEALVSKKYGATWEERKTNLEKELRETLTKEITDSVTKKFQAKLQQKGKQAKTNISTAKAASKGSKPAKGKSFGQMLGR